MTPLSEPHLAYLHYLMHRDFKPAMIRWAENVLLAGGGGEAITLLAGADHECEPAVLDLFRQAAAEQGIELPGEDDAYCWNDGWREFLLCREICDGILTPQAGLKELVRFYFETGQADLFDVWPALQRQVNAIAEGRKEGGRFMEMTGGEVDEFILKAARRVLAEGPKPPDCPMGWPRA